MWRELLLLAATPIFPVVVGAGVARAAVTAVPPFHPLRPLPAPAPLIAIVAVSAVAATAVRIHVSFAPVVVPTPISVLVLTSIIVFAIAAWCCWALVVMAPLLVTADIVIAILGGGLDLAR